MTPDILQNLASQFSDEIIDIRRALHTNPELSFKEFETAALIERKLDEWGIEHERIAITGITGIINGNGMGKYLVIRADIDALPIQEMNTCEYKSKNPGIMHACGHDVHTAVLLGAIRILFLLKESWSGSIRFIFQPAEELLPGGALKILESGLLDHPAPDYIIAEHVSPELPAGTFGFREGSYMASTDEIHLTVRGVGGHGAMPHELIDPVLIASHLVVGLQQVVSRKLPPTIPAVLSFGKVDAPGSTNVIPPFVRLEGTFRIMDEKWRQIAHDQIRKISNGIVESMGGTLECTILKGYPAVVNDPELTRMAKNIAASFVGVDHVTELQLRMTGEDFSRYSQKIPSVFYRLGTGGTDTNFPVHHPKFDVNEDSIRYGISMMAWLAVNLTKK